MPHQNREQRRLPWAVLLIYGSLALGMTVTGYVYYVRQQVGSRNDKEQELSAIADLKVEEIAGWRDDRRAHAHLIRDNRLRASHLRELLRNPSSRQLRQEAFDWIRLLREDFRYATVLFVDTSMRVIQSYPPTRDTLGAQTAMHVRKALQTRKELFSGFYRDDVTRYIQMDLVAPLLVGTGSSSAEEPVGAIVLRIDPYQSIYPILHSWPTSSPTSEVLLLRREGDEMLFLNDSRFRAQTALALRIPVRDSQMVEAKAADEPSVAFYGIDYRHARVLAVTRKISEPPWYLLVKIDLDEVEAPVRGRSWMIGVIVGLMILAAGSIAVTFWWNEQAKYFRNQYTLELEREALVQHFESLTKYANDIILLKDSEGNIIEANDSALSNYGYSRREMLGLNIRDLRIPEAASRVENDMKQIRESNGLVFETVHRRKDGTTFPVEVSSRAITIDKMTFYQSIIRNITERKQAELRVVTYNCLYALLNRTNAAIFSLRNEQELFDEVCSAAVNDGKFKIAWVGLVDPRKESLMVVGLQGIVRSDVLMRWLSADGESGGSAPLLTSLLRGQQVIYNDVADSGCPKLWIDDAVRYGFRSLAAFPLWVSNTVYAALGLHSQDVNFFDQGKLQLLEGLTGNLSHALDSLRKQG